MTPQRLELSGFTCFKALTVVDFSNLELFAISGPTGSGKSTLLDALTYALYGQTARLGSKGLDVLLSPGINQMYVTLAFSTAQGSYRVTRTADKKPSGKVDRNTRIEVLQPDASYKQLPESEKLKEADAKLAAIVGLDYDGFTRSVLLPQGAFDEFLKGDSSKRRNLLINLLGLDKVEAMQKEAGRLAREADIKQKNISERLEQDFFGATPEKRTDLEEQLKVCQTELKKLLKRQTDLSQELKSLEATKELLEEQQKLEETLERLGQQAEQIKLNKVKLELARKAQLIAPQLDQAERLELRLKSSQDQLNELKLSSEKQKQQKQSSQEQLVKQIEEVEKQLPLLNRKLLELAAVAPLMSQLKAKGGHLGLASGKQTLDYSDEAWHELQTNLAQLPLLKQNEANLDKQSQDVKQSQEALKTLQASIKKYEEETKHLIQQGKEARAQLEEYTKAYQEAEIANRALVLREHLHEGDACPVCEQIINQLPVSKEISLSELKNSQDQAQENLDKTIEQYKTSQNRLNLEQDRYKDKQEALTVQELILKELSQLVEQQREALKVASCQEAIKSLEVQKQALLAALAQSIKDKTDGQDPNQAEQRYQSQKETLERALKQAEKAVQEANQALQASELKAEHLEKQVIDSQGDLKEILSLVEASLKNANFTTKEQAKEALLSEQNIKTLELEQTNFASQKEAAERRHVELQAKLSGTSFSKTQYETVKQEEQENKQQSAEKQTMQGRLENELKTMNEQLERAKVLQKERAEQQKTFDTYRQLSLDLRGNEFQEFLLSQVQAKLALRASHILRDVTDGRYNLRLVEGDYQVIDAWNTDDIRNVKTLSGGETFITSLALALALSDTIAGNHALGALFLDEGFGTLDAITLDSVAQVLENLTKEGRMVGIITHVTALTERLPARLSVTKGIEGSSLSWDIA